MWACVIDCSDENEWMNEKFYSLKLCKFYEWEQ